MSSNDKLEPGDLAIVIKSLDGHAIGKVVECIQIDGTHSLYGIIWLVKSTRQDLVTEYGGVGDNAHVPQDWLRKIPRDPLPDEEDLYSLDKLEELVN